MKVLDADHERRYEIPGVPGPARRPVDIDAAKTGFQRLRSLRLYRFEAGSTIDGHAEEDEVFVVVTSGSVRIRTGVEEFLGNAETHILSAPDGDNLSEAPFVAYLPPRSVYQMTPLTTVDVAYARATPQRSSAPAIFSAHMPDPSDEICMLMDQRDHAERLRLQVRRVDARSSVRVELPGEDAAGAEALVHVQGSPATMGTVSAPGWPPQALHAWQTLAFEPGEAAFLDVTQGVRALIVTVFAV